MQGIYFISRLLCVKSKACEARPVDDTASRVWRRGQNIRGVMPQNIWGTARVYKRTTEKMRSILTNYIPKAMTAEAKAAIDEVLAKAEASVQ